MKVHIGNKNANGDGYMFRKTDDWSGVPGNTIVRTFTFRNVPSALWGDGSIEVEGEGSVENPVICLAKAYAVISKRTGKTVDGVFIKD